MLILDSTQPFLGGKNRTRHWPWRNRDSDSSGLNRWRFETVKWQGEQISPDLVISCQIWLKSNQNLMEDCKETLISQRTATNNSRDWSNWLDLGFLSTTVTQPGSHLILVGISPVWTTLPRILAKEKRPKAHSLKEICEIQTLDLGTDFSKPSKVLAFLSPTTPHKTMRYHNPNCYFTAST